MGYMPSTNFGLRTMILVLVFGIAVGSLFQIGSIANADNESTQQQDILRLESRITQLEQRLYTIENSVRNVEQQSRIGSMSSRTVSQDDLNVLRSGLQALERRLGDDECGLAKLDERTLSPQRRRKSTAGDPNQCRENSDAPLRLP